MTEITADQRQQARAMHWASIVARHERRVENAHADVAEALTRLRQRGWDDRHLFASSAADLKRAADELSAAAEGLAVLREVSWLADQEA